MKIMIFWALLLTVAYCDALVAPALVKKECIVYMNKPFNCRVLTNRGIETKGTKSLRLWKSTPWLKASLVGGYLKGVAPSQREVINRKLPMYADIGLRMETSNFFVRLKLQEPVGNDAPALAYGDLFVPDLLYIPGQNVVNYTWYLPFALFQDPDGNELTMTASSDPVGLFYDAEANAIVGRDIAVANYTVKIVASDAFMAATTERFEIKAFPLAGTVSSNDIGLPYNNSVAAGLDFTVKIPERLVATYGPLIVYSYPRSTISNTTWLKYDYDTSNIYASPDIEDLGEWIVYFQFESKAYIELNYKVFYDLALVQLNETALRAEGGRSVDIYVTPLNRTVVGRLRALRATSGQDFSYEVPMDIFKSYYHQSIDPEVDLYDALNGSFPTWIQTDFIDQTIYLYGQTPNNLTSQRLVLCITLYGQTDMETKQFCFFLDVIVDKRRLPTVRGRSADNLVNSATNEPFSWPIPNDLFSSRRGPLNYSLDTFPFAVWLSLNEESKTLEGTPSEKMNTTAVIIAADQDGARSFFQLQICIDCSSSEDNSQSENDNSLIIALTVIVALSCLLLCLLSIFAFFKCRKKKENELQKGTKSYTTFEELKEKLKKIEQEDDLLRVYEPSPLERSYMSFDRSSSLGTSLEVDPKEYVTVIGEVGRAFYFVYPEKRLTGQSSNGEELDDSSSELSICLFNKGSRGLDLESEVVRANETTSESPVSVISHNKAFRYSQSTLSEMIRDYNPNSFNQDEKRMKFTARLWPSKRPLPSWLHFNPEKCSFFGIPYVFDVGTLKIEVIASNWGSPSSDLTDKSYYRDVFILKIALTKSE
jgi:uncharacterized protein YxeA